MTLTDLYAQTLIKMQITAAGESPDPDDSALIGTKYTALYALLLSRGLVSWALADDVPDEAVQPLVQMLSYASAASFGPEQGRYATGELDVNPPMPAERQLKKNVARSYVSYTQPTVYF